MAKVSNPGAQRPTITKTQELVDELNALAREIQDSDPAHSRELCAQVRALIEAHPEADPAITTPRLAETLYTLSVLDWDQSCYEQALAYAIEAHALFVQTGNLSRQASSVNHMAGIYFFLGDYARAIELSSQALALAEASEDRSLYASCLNDSAYIRLHMDQFDEALPQLFESLAIHREMGTREGETQALESLGKAYYLLGDYEQALRFEHESLAINQTVGYRRAETDALHNIGKIYAASGDVTQAQAAMTRALQQSRERGYRQFEAALLVDQGKLALTEGDTALAEHVLAEALPIAQNIRSRPVVVDVFFALSQLYEKMGDPVRALDHYKQFHAAREELLVQRNSIIMHGLQVRHQLEQARSEAEIYHLRNVELQREIEEREQLIADLNAFAHTVAHDLKNPLSAVIGYADLLVSDLNTGMLTDAVGYASTLVDAGLKAVHIVDDLLLLASVRRQDITLTPVAMGPVVLHVTRRLAQAIDERQAVLTLPEQWPLILGHEPWIEQVWINYISNAVKYGGDPPRIVLGADRDGDMIRCWVRDNGRGIPPDKHERLFSQFDRLDTTQSTGHGLGLSIVKRIVEKLGGTVAVESTGQPGQGCVFSFSLPAAPPPAE